MLRIKMNRRNASLTYKELAGSNGQQNSISDSEGTIRINTTDKVNTFHHPAVHFVREDGDIAFHDSRKIVGGQAGSYVDTEVFPQFRAFIESAEVISNARRNPGDAAIRKFVKIKLTTPHNNATYRDYGIDEVMRNPDTFATGIQSPKRCVGDHFLYEWFLYEIRSVRNGEYLFSNATMINNRQRMTIYSDRFSEGFVTVNCYIPIDSNNRDITDTLILEYTDNEIADVIVDGDYSEILLEDCRFYDRAQNAASGRVYITLRPGTRLCLESGNLRVSVPIAEDFATNLYMEDALDAFAKARADDSVNGIVDYEKMRFTPCYESDGGIKLYNSITFKIHLRNRVLDDEWKVDDGQYWFARPEITGPADSILESDLVSALGFDDTDIYYQKAKVKNTFLRLSFYNSNDRRTQQLLYTAKLYLDSGKLFGKFIKDAEHYDWIGQIVDDNGDGREDFEPLYLNFTCSNSLDTGNTSEGFYLYLFPSNLDEDTEEYISAGTIYMKAELNNSKYGYTVPLTLPRGCDGEPLDFSDSKFPLHYIRKNGDVMGPDMTRFNNDTFIPLTVFKKDKGYYWKFGGKDNLIGLNGNDDLEITLFEPRMNGEEDPAGFSLNCDVNL